MNVASETRERSRSPRRESHCVQADEKMGVAPPPSVAATKELPLKRGQKIQWAIKFAQGNTFKTFMENIASVLGECAFQVVNTPKFKGLVVEFIDPQRVCMLQGRLSGQVETLDEIPRFFCVRMQPVLAFLRNITPSFFVEIWSPVDSTDIVIHLYEPRIGTHFPKCTFRTLAKNQDSYQLEGQEFDIFCEIDLQTFRTAIKTAKDHHADTICITVYTPKRNPDEPTNLRTHFFVISYEGEEVSSQFPYQSTTEINEDESEDSPQIIKATEAANREFEELPPETDLNMIYQGRFGCDSIANFVKSLDRACLTLHLGNNKPMLLDYPLGSSMSSSSSEGGDYIRFICAPRSD